MGVERSLFVYTTRRLLSNKKGRDDDWVTSIGTAYLIRASHIDLKEAKALPSFPKSEFKRR